MNNTKSNGAAVGKGSNPLQMEVQVPPAVVALLSSMGIPLPPNMKEISADVLEDENTNTIILPKGMGKLKAAKELENQWKNEETENDYIAQFEGWNWRDVLVAVRRVTDREFGWMNGQPNWWTGNPKEIDIVVDIKKGKHVNEKAFLGDFRITGWEDANSKVGVNDAVAYVKITAKKKYSTAITNYFNVIRQQLETESIYRGKNIVVTANGNNDLNFEIIENKGSDKIFLNHDENLLFETFVIGSLGEKNKRCYLFTGEYGNGKTETAMKAGRIAVENHGMSFFYLKDAKVFDLMLNQSKKYQPCIVFLEDIDEIASGETRDAAMNKILNTLDGVQTKGNDLTVILTTNHANRIAPPLRRPGRIDLMIKFSKPNDECKEKIFRSFFDELEGGKELDYAYLLEKTPEVTGAVVAEIAKRAVKMASNKGNVITTSDIESCVISMKYQIELMEEKVDIENKHEKFISLFGELLGDAIFGAGTGEQIKANVQYLYDEA